MSKMKTKGEALNEQIVITSELAAVVGKTPQWIRELTRDGVLKQVSRGKYVLGDALKAYIAHVQTGINDDGRVKYRDVKTDHELIKKEKAELELRALKGQLHEAKDVRRVMNHMILTAKSKIQAIPSRVAIQLENESANVIEDVLTREIIDTLQNLSQYSPSHFEKEDDDE